jgi:acyl-CoA reductase-like NAD-dependent aldehyde dehydrogenase
VLSGFGPAAGVAIVLHPTVNKIAYTGCTAIGKRIQKLASTNGLKCVSLELGGKSPVIFWTMLTSTKLSNLHMLNCLLIKANVAVLRLGICSRRVYDKFVAAAVAKAKNVKLMNRGQKNALTLMISNSRRYWFTLILERKREPLWKYDNAVSSPLSVPKVWIKNKRNVFTNLKIDSVEKRYSLHKT